MFYNPYTFLDHLNLQKENKNESKDYMIDLSQEFRRREMYHLADQRHSGKGISRIWKMDWISTGRNGWTQQSGCKELYKPKRQIIEGNVSLYPKISKFLNQNLMPGIKTFLVEYYEEYSGPEWSR